MWQINWKVWWFLYLFSHFKFTWSEKFLIVSRIFTPMVKERVLHLMVPTLNLYVKSWKYVCCDSFFFVYIGSCSYSWKKQFCHLLDSIYCSYVKFVGVVVDDESSIAMCVNGIFSTSSGTFVEGTLQVCFEFIDP